MITVNQKAIAKLNPCKERFDNYIKHYGDRDFTTRQFMGLKNITHSDKLWVAFRMMNRSQINEAVADIAESVLHFYKSKHPGDRRVRECIEAIREYKKGGITREQLEVKRSDAYAAVYAADAAAAYAADAAAAYAAAYAAYDARANAKRVQEKRNRTIILKYWKE